MTGEQKKTRKKASLETKKKKLSYKEQIEYSSLEPEIGELEKEKEMLEEEMNAGNLDYEILSIKSVRVAEIIDLIDAKMQRWIELAQYV